MVSPVGPRLYPNPYWVLDEEQNINENTAKKEDSAAAEVVSLYYQSSISSMADHAFSPAKQDASEKITASQTQKTWFSRSKDWLWNLFGIAKNQPAAQLTGDVEDGNPIDNGIPRLAAPDDTDQRQMSKTVSDLNRDLSNRLKDISEFEEEMRKSGGNKLDKLIFLQLVYSSLYQKNLKEESSVAAHRHLMDLYNKNKTLQKTYYNLLDDINSRAKTKKILHWTNIGLTAGIVGALAVTFATGGTAAILLGGVGISLLSLGKGATTLTQGVMQYKNDRKTGDMFIISQDTKANTKSINDEMTKMQSNDEDISSLLKTIRHHLENQSRAERANFGRNT